MTAPRYRRSLDGWWIVEVDGRQLGQARRVRSGFDPLWEARLADGRRVYRMGVGIRSRAEAAEAIMAETGVKSDSSSACRRA